MNFAVEWTHLSPSNTETRKKVELQDLLKEMTISLSVWKEVSLESRAIEAKARRKVEGAINYVKGSRKAESDAEMCSLGGSISTLSQVRS